MLEQTRQNPDRTSTSAQSAARRLGTLWCDVMHDSPMWPIHGQYTCRSCGRSYPVPWASDGPAPAPARTLDARPIRIREAGVPSFRSAILPLAIFGLLVTVPLKAADEPVVDAASPAAMAFARYTVGLEQTRPWSLETVEIDASLPKLEKHGRLRAIRRLLPFGKPEYQVLEIAGDKTVRQQVIVRYLSAEVQAAAIPSSTVAISAANYKFHYKGAVINDGTLAYVFLITPRKKREGLIKGELWLDGETGAVVRESGFLVKKPSIFVKRVDVVKETTLCDGNAEERTTHLSVDTRLVGRAELTIHERPVADPEPASPQSIAGR